jgi:hypothetical protein
VNIRDVLDVLSSRALIVIVYVRRTCPALSLLWI